MAADYYCVDKTSCERFTYTAASLALFSSTLGLGGLWIQNRGNAERVDLHLD